MKKSLILHRQAFLGISAASVFGHDIEVGSYHGVLVYNDLCHQQNTTIKYDEQFMNAMREKFQKCFHDQVVHLVNVERDVVILPAQFCSMRYINDDRYLLWYKAPELDHVSNVRQLMRRSIRHVSRWTS